MLEQYIYSTDFKREGYILNQSSKPIPNFKKEIILNCVEKDFHAYMYVCMYVCMYV